MGIFGFGKKKEDKNDKKDDKKESRKDVAPIRNVQKADIVKTNGKKADKTADLKKSENKSGLPSEKFSNIACRILIEPRVTEKSHDLMASNKYVFKITKESGKSAVKKAIEELYGVKVIKVNTINIPPKKRTYARKVGWKSGYKKAIVTLKKGDRIELFEGA